MEINVTPFSNRGDMMKKRLMNFLKWLQDDYNQKHGTDVDLMGLTVEKKTIRRIVNVNGGNSNIEFALGQQGATLRDGETTLDNSDAFMPTQLALGFSKLFEGTVDANQIAIAANQEIFPYPDKTVFDFAGVSTAPPEWAALLSYYYGTMELQTNKKTVISEFHTSRLLKVAQVQQYADAAAMRYVQDGRFEPLFNNPLLDGNKTNKFVFRPSANANTDNASGDTDEQNIAVLDVQGFVVKDLSTSVNALNNAYYWVS